MIPNGQGTRKEIHNPALIDWIRQASGKAELVLSVCIGALHLARAGLLEGQEATTHHLARFKDIAIEGTGSWAYMSSTWCP